jgi:hypothetical protein
LAEEPVGFEAICDANPAINDGFEIADMMSDGLMIDAMLLHESMSA